MNKSSTTTLEASRSSKSGTDFDAIEIALLAGVEGGMRGGAPLRGFCRTLPGRSFRIGRDPAVSPNSCSAVSFIWNGEQGAILVRNVKGFQAGGGKQERWFVPYSAFGSVMAMCRQAVKVD